ncbi:PREDICTED: uncharacterized protein LOC109591003, partial [Amphimedon queenslandica]|uniref:Uncharacterized protein n=1 Tax=Amphimedon queenslandica TaxID=400682 RepID=A0A1X7SX76_AMPQE
MNENLTKQIEELKTKVVEREIIIVKLVKEKSELEEELQKDITTAKDNEKQLKEKEPVKDADIQFDYSTFPSKEETEKLKACIAMLTKEKSLFEENNEKSLGKIEKLEVGVADSLTYITTLTDEKTLINEENKKLKVQVVDKDILIAKLMKKESQLKEELQSLKDISTDTKCIQCDYWTKAELPFDGMVTLGKKVCLYNANSSHELQLDECGLTLSLPDGLLSPVDSTVYEAAAQGLWGGDFEFPAGTHLISSVCYISVSPNAAQLDKPVTVQLVHCAHLTSQFQSQYLSFVVAEVQPGKQSGPFKFELLPGGSFSPDSQTGSIELKSFSLIAIVIVVSAGVAGIVAGSGAAVGVATVGAAAVGVAKIGNLAFNAFKNVTPPVPPSFHCRGLFYKKYWTNEVIVSLAVLPDLPAFKEPFKDDPVALSLLGELRRTFPFTFSKDKNNCLKVTNIPKRNIEGWRFTGCNTEITETHVVRYSSGQSSEPPYIQISVQPDETDIKEKLSHTLSVDDIQTPSGVSSVPWNIEVSKNDLSSTAFLSG